MRAHLLIEVAFHLARQKEIPEKTSYLRCKGHGEHLTTTLPKPGQSPRRCVPSVWFPRRVASGLLSSIGSISRGDCSPNRPRKPKSSLLLPSGEELERENRV